MEDSAREVVPLSEDAVEMFVEVGEVAEEVVHLAPERVSVFRSFVRSSIFSLFLFTLPLLSAAMLQTAIIGRAPSEEVYIYQYIVCCIFLISHRLLTHVRTHCSTVPPASHRMHVSHYIVVLLFAIPFALTLFLFPFPPVQWLASSSC